MAKDRPTELHGDYESSMGFNTIVREAINHIRSSMDFLPQHRKADLYVSGTIHALRKLCDGEAMRGFLDCGLRKSEVEAWREEFFAWFKRVQRQYSAKTREEFRANAEDAFQVLMDAAKKDGRYAPNPPTERYLTITFKSRDALDAACAAADEKHPVDLGHALSKYLDRCIRELVGEPPAKKAPAVAKMESKPKAISPTILPHDDGSYSLTLSDFLALDEDDGDWELTAYDLEAAVKTFLSERRPSYLKHLHFDCESSLFCVVSKSIPALSQVADVIFRFFGDEKLRGKYLRRE